MSSSVRSQTTRLLLPQFLLNSHLIEFGIPEHIDHDILANCCDNYCSGVWYEGVCVLIHLVYLTDSPIRFRRLRTNSTNM